MGLVILFVSFFALLIMRLPLAFSIGLSSIAYFLFRGDINMMILLQKMFTGADSFAMLALPLYILAGEIMNVGGIAKKLINFCMKCVGHIRGGLGMVNVLVSMIFGGISGSAVADTSALGSILIPSMVEKGYDADFSAAVTSASATIGIIIPPSITMILYGVVSGASIGKLFIAGIIPGVIVTVSQMVYCYFAAIKHGYPTEGRFSWKELGLAIKDAAWALIMPLIILGSIIFGIATPTEAAGIAVVYGLVVSKLIYHTITWSELKKMLYNTVITTGQVMIIVAFSSIFGWILSYEKVPTILAEFILRIAPNKYVLMLLIDILVLILGTFLHGTPIVLVVIPILLPLVQQVGIDLVHFGLIVTLGIGIGQQTPPVGSCLFVTSALAKLDIMEVAKANIPFIIMFIVTLLLITYVPGISLFLPSLMG